MHENIKYCIREGIKKNFLGDMSPISGGVSNPLPLKKSTFFTQNVKNIQPCPEFFFKPFFCNVYFLVTLFFQCIPVQLVYV